VPWGGRDQFLLVDKISFFKTDSLDGFFFNKKCFFLAKKQFCLPPGKPCVRNKKISLKDIHFLSKQFEKTNLDHERVCFDMGFSFRELNLKKNYYSSSIKSFS
jgi:hypothetical protein